MIADHPSYRQIDTHIYISIDILILNVGKFVSVRQINKKIIAISIVLQFIVIIQVHDHCHLKYTVLNMYINNASTLKRSKSSNQRWLTCSDICFLKIPVSLINGYRTRADFLPHIIRTFGYWWIINERRFAHNLWKYET